MWFYLIVFQRFVVFTEAMVPMTTLHLPHTNREPHVLGEREKCQMSWKLRQSCKAVLTSTQTPPTAAIFTLDQSAMPLPKCPQLYFDL